jgi:hypothetical protein
MVGRGGTPARRISNTFLRAAMGPVEYAASCILSNRILTGLEELAPDGLLAGYQRGVSEVATLAGVPRVDVESSLPMAAAQSVGQRLLISQANAIVAWKLHAGPFGFMDVITALTVDGRRPDISACIERLAQKVRQDKGLSLPLSELARDMLAYTELVADTRAKLEGGEWLETALRRRQQKRIVFASLAVLTLLIATTSVVFVRVKRDSAQALIERTDECLIKDLAEADSSWATAAALELRDQKRTACEQRQRLEAEQRLAEEARLRKEREAREVVEKRKAACKALVEAVNANKLDGATLLTAAESAELMKRLAAKKLASTDFGPDDPRLPCADTEDGARISSSLEATLLVDPTLWARHPSPSPFLEKALLAARPRLPETALIGLADNAERTAKSGLSRGEPDTIARAKKLCALAKSLGVPGHSGCSAVSKL